jgi:hypothetical protein
LFAGSVICCDFSICFGLSSPVCKNISLHPSGKSSLQIRAIPSHRGRIAIVTDAGWDAVDAAASCAQRDRRAGEEPVSDQQHADERRLQRTAKSCGPDAPTLASSSRMLCRPNRASDTTLVRRRRWQKSPVTEESTKEPVKTIACGNAGRFRCTRCYSCAFYHYEVRTRLRVQRAPGIPHALFGREINANLGRNAPRGRSRERNYINVIASEAKQSILSSRRAMDCFASLAMTVLETGDTTQLAALTTPAHC